MSARRSPILPALGGTPQQVADSVRLLEERPKLPSVKKASLPPQADMFEMIGVSDESGGAVPAFWDGSHWRRVTDRAVVS